MRKYLALLSVLALLGCAEKKVGESSSNMKLEDQEYKISKIIDKANEKEYAASGDWSIVIDDSRFGMFVGCNRIFGGIKQENGKITYVNPASTKMMCLDDMMAVEDLLVKNLNTMNINEDGLENNNIIIIFKQD